MSKRSKEKSPVLADWEVAHQGGTVTVSSSRWRCGKRGGYTFTDPAGVAYHFPPGSVRFVRRQDLAMLAVGVAPSRRADAPRHLAEVDGNTVRAEQRRTPHEVKP